MREGQSVLRVQLLNLGGGLKKPWLGEGLSLGTAVSRRGQGKVRALAATELSGTAPEQ